MGRIAPTPPLEVGVKGNTHEKLIISSLVEYQILGSLNCLMSFGRTRVGEDCAWSSQVENGQTCTERDQELNEIFCLVAISHF